MRRPEPVTAVLERALLVVASVLFVGSVGFFLAAHASLSAVMFDLLVAALRRT